jgi:hypothetical protein
MGHNQTEANMMKVDCDVRKETIEAAFNEYVKTYGTDSDRFRKMGIDFGKERAIWRLWILALMYQGMSEEASETSYLNIPREGLTFDPEEISAKAEKCGCPFLLSANKVHFCDFITSQRCSRQAFVKDCPVPLIREEIRRFPRISRGIVSSAIYLRDYEFSFENLCASIQVISVDIRTDRMLNVLTMIGGSEKISHMFLRWISNSLPSGNWGLDARKFLAVDQNLKKVTRTIGLCRSPNSSIVRAHLQELLSVLGMNDPKDPEKLEIALLHVGQEHCDKGREEACQNEACPFYGRNASF